MKTRTKVHLRKGKIDMLGSNEKISNTQLVAVTVSTMMGIGVLSLPAGLANALGTDGWILIFINGFLATLLTIAVTIVMKSFKGKTFIDFGKDLVTSPISVAISIIFCIYFIGLSSFGVRIFGEVIKMFLLETTPIEVVILTMLLTTSYLVRSGIEGLGRMALVLFPIVVIPVGFLILTTLPDMDYTNLLPVFDFSLMELIKAIPVTFFSFIGFEFLLIHMAFVDKPEKSLKYNLASIAIVTVSYAVVFATSLGSLGESELAHQLWPPLSLMKTIEFPGAFIENVEGIVMTLWVLAILTTLAPALFGITLIISKLFKGKEHNYFVLPLVPIIYFASLIPENLPQVYSYLDVFTYYVGTFAAIVVPILFFVLVLIMKKNKKEASKNG